MTSWEQFLEKQYTTPGGEGAFSSAGKLLGILHKAGYTDVKQKQIQTWLEKAFTYVIHKSRRVNYPRNPTIAQHIDHIWQADILFLADIASFNDRKPCILLCIDLVSRFAWVEPMMSKHGTSTSRAFEKILTRSNSRVPKKLHTDKGREFYNKHFQDVMKKYDIQLYSTESDKKAAIAERCIKEVKKLIYRYMTSKQSNRYIDNLQLLIDTYNRTYHSSIGMAPEQVTEETQGRALQNLYGDFWKSDRIRLKMKANKFHVGDKVRISLKKDLFTKGYKGFWTTEVFTIEAVKNTRPLIQYRLKDSEGESLTGLFYETELQSVSEETNRFTHIKTILKKKTIKGKPWVLVNWENEDPKITRWMPQHLLS
jgi:hypothetical protein